MLNPKYLTGNHIIDKILEDHLKKITEQNSKILIDNFFLGFTEENKKRIMELYGLPYHSEYNKIWRYVNNL